MQKRNKPIVLLTLLLVLGGTAAFMSASDRFGGGGGGHAHDAPPPQDESVTGQRRESTVDKKALASKAGQLMGKEAPARPSPPGMEGAEGAENSKPLIVREKPQPYKPMPNDSSVAGQWYTDEGAKDYKTKK